MKIVQYIHSLDIGGAEIHTLELCKGLVKLGHEVIIVGPEGSLGSEFEKDILLRGSLIAIHLPVLLSRARLTFPNAPSPIVS